MGKSVEPNTAASRAEDGAGLGVTKKQGIHDDLCASRRVVREVIDFVDEQPGQTLLSLTATVEGDVVSWTRRGLGASESSPRSMGGRIDGSPVVGKHIVFFLNGRKAHGPIVKSIREVFGPCNCPSAVFQKSPAKTVVLGPDHEGMRIDASGVLCNNNKGSTQFRKMMLGHLQDLAQRYYAGDTGAVDDFLQTYCLGVDARKLAKERQGVAAAAEGGR